MGLTPTNAGDACGDAAEEADVRGRTKVDAPVETSTKYVLPLDLLVRSAQPAGSGSDDDDDGDRGAGADERGSSPGVPGAAAGGRCCAMGLTPTNAGDACGDAAEEADARGRTKVDAPAALT